MLIVRFLLRFLLIPLGLIAAMLAGTLLLTAVLGTKFLTMLAADPDAGGDAIAMLLFATPAIFAALASVSIAMMLPALLAVAIAEIAAIRSWLYYPAAGGLAAWIGSWSLTGTQSAFNDPTLIAAAGIAGGLAYWLVAGWNAGFWTPVFAPPPAPPPQALPLPPAR